MREFFKFYAMSDLRLLGIPLAKIRIDSLAFVGFPIKLSKTTKVNTLKTKATQVSPSTEEYLTSLSLRLVKFV